ncbi:restriction endonuclease subunit S [Streptomyces ipomoeae]|uniref:restriction endonuclease subunit S n=1 Tax=Streptomyces ipomoeae TaxID=103232 RepID=UPI0029A48841|nr:restriction endonuclease subunit S [Streptomyces ipomoeae]MDX2821346.1 restriction endonuclease subunit S [Streptomyces ipomoeae]MDX2873665.1 restriction endonuclease subunit S [Streptomyces ipomoeae]
MSLSIGVPWVLPKGWAWATFADVAHVASNLVSPLDYPDLPHIAPNHIESDTGRLLPFSTVAEDGVKSPKHLFAEGHILYSKIRPYLAKVVTAKFDGLCSADMYPIATEIDPGFLALWLRSPAFTGFAAKHQGRSVLPKINKEALAKLPVPVPPLDEQRRVAAALEGQLSRLDAADGTLQVSARRIDRYLQAALHGMTSSCDSVQLCDVLTSGLTNGRSVQTREGGFPVLRLTALSDTYVDLAQCKEGDWEAEEAESFLVREGDFLISRGNGSVSLVGRGSLVLDVSTPVAYPDTIIRARPDVKVIMPEYLRIVWSSLAVRRQIESQARTTAGIHKVNQKILGAIEFPLPDMSTQQALCAQWSSIEQQARRLTRTVSVSKRRSATLRRSLLAEAFAGRLVPQDPADEPADALLARIRAEREAAGPTKARRRSSRRTPAQRKRTPDTAPAPDAPPPLSADVPALATATQPTLDLEIPS